MRTDQPTLLEEISMKQGLVFAVLSILALAATPGRAQLVTYVSGLGDDTNPCSRTAPCHSFGGALTKSPAGGEIHVLDPANYGGVTITKPITLSAEGSIGVIVLIGGDGIVVNVPNATDLVVIRGLDLQGAGSQSGIKLVKGGVLQIEHCTIQKYSLGIDFQPSVAGSQLHVIDTIVSNNGSAGTGGGISIAPTGASGKATLDNVRIENNVFGLKAQGPANVSVSRSLAANNNLAGFASASNTTTLTLEQSVSTHNGAGVDCSAGTVRIGNMSISDNGTALATGGSCFSYKNNNVDVAIVVTPVAPQ
jgi:hypothetical protein